MVKRKTPEEYIKECKENKLDLPIEKYINTRTKIKHMCKKGHIYSQRPADHLKGDGCRICSGNKKKNPEEYLKECKEKGLDLPVEDYVNATTKINHICSKGHIYPQTPNSHLYGQGCPKCSGNMRKSHEDYYNECKESKLDLPIERYVNIGTKIKHKCKYNHIYSQRPADHLRSIGCPLCSESHGEKFIRNYLDKHNIKYEPQKRFHDLKDKQPLSYDFYLPNYNILIEYQGIQHFESVSFNGKDYTDLDKQKRHDNLKRAYAKDNGYRLLELHYSLDTQDKVDKYLKRRINY